jgi:TolB-like protein
MSPLLTLALLAAAVDPAAGADDDKPNLLVLGLEPAGVTPDEAKILDGMIANALTRHADIQVVTSDELKQMMELEGEKQALGCDDTSCLGEIAGAMGAQYVLFGKAGRFGELFVVQVNLFDSTQAKAVTRQEIQERELEQVAERVQPAVDAIVAHITGAPVVTPEVSSGGLSPLLLVGAGVGATGLVVAGASGAGLAVFLLQLGDPKSLRADKTTAADLAPWTIAGVGVGTTLLLAGAGIAVAGLVIE